MRRGDPRSTAPRLVEVRVQTSCDHAFVDTIYNAACEPFLAIALGLYIRCAPCVRGGRGRSRSGAEFD